MIPKEARKRLSRHQSDKLQTLVEGSATTPRPAKRADNPFAQFRGALADATPGTVEGIVGQQQLMRGRDRT
jgi:hypothetical protein